MTMHFRSLPLIVLSSFCLLIGTFFVFHKTFDAFSRPPQASSCQGLSEHARRAAMLRDVGIKTSMGRGYPHHVQAEDYAYSTSYLNEEQVAQYILWACQTGSYPYAPVIR
jgi:hypothetical protein